MNSLEKIVKKYSNINHNDDNFSVGGGLDEYKFASRRHEDAKNDSGKITLGAANSMFAKATNLSTAEVKELIMFHFDGCLEWHHAGQLPKTYGGGMKKTYFLNAKQIVEFATHFEKIQQIFINRNNEKLEREKSRLEREKSREEFLNTNARKVERVIKQNLPQNYITISEEMKGKYGWFDAQSKYNLDIYVTAWVFDNKELYDEYIEIFYRF